MKRLLMFIAGAVLVSGVAFAFTNTTNQNLHRPDVGDSGTSWALGLQRNVDVLDAAFCNRPAAMTPGRIGIINSGGCFEDGDILDFVSGFSNRITFAPDGSGGFVANIPSGALSGSTGRITVTDNGISGFAFNAPNHVKYNAVTTDKFFLNTTVYDTISLSAIEAKPGPASPGFSNFAAIGNIGSYAFDNSLSEELYFTASLPSSWAVGTDIFARAIWSPMTTATGLVDWKLEYSWVNKDSAFTTSATINSPASASGTQYAHQAQTLGTITGSGKTLLSRLLMRLYRHGASAADTYTGDAALLSLDLVHMVNTVGSSSEWAK